MNRRDTIIIAVLLNAGLLIVLFATSLKTDKGEEETPQVQVLSSNQPEMKELRPVAAIPSAPLPPDEVDQAIKQYVTPQTSSDQPNFLVDLNGFGASPATPLATPAVADSAPSFKEIKVKKGDVLERIARQNHVSVDEIMKANKLGSTRLKIGQSLKIPVQESKKGAVGGEEGQFYIVKNGDNPWTIAVKNHMKVEELLKLNHMDEEKARRLKPGDRIRIK